MSIRLNEDSKKSIEKRIGLSVSDISKMDVEELDLYIEKRIGKKLKFRISKNPFLVGRGSVYLYLKRLLGIDIIEKKLSKI